MAQPQQTIPAGKFDVFWEQHPVDLTPKEKLLKSEMLAEELHQLDQLDLKKKLFMDDWKASVAEHETKRDELARHVRTGKEYRDVECFESPQYEDSTVEIIRRDTGEVVRKRAMRPDERQQKMPFVDAHGESCTPDPKQKRLPSPDNDNDGDEFSRGLQ
jgi:hypothetical protein